MNDRASLWLAAAQAAEQGTVAALATVARKRGSLPLSDDAKMLVTAGGLRLGTVGGGCVEAEVTEQALATVTAGRPAIVRHTLNADLAGDVGLSCGGTVELFLEPLLTDQYASCLYREVADAIQQRRQVTVLTALDWSSEPRKALKEGAERRSSFLDERASIFVEPIPRAPRVIVFGAGHVGVEIARIAAGTGFYVISVDDREEFANDERIPWAEEIVVDDFGKALDRLTLEPDDFVIAATRGHAFDANIIERAARSYAGYVGMLGSKRKLAVVRKALEAAGVSSADLDRVRCPIGEDIGADTPAEIAVSVVAELIRVRRRSANALE
jgi:xanthine dehydrogenase accessory factor